jgi:sn-glycerol 3-phosphate transport system ATP-binding protein
MEIYARPADTYVAGFIGAPAMNFCDARLAQGGHAAVLADGTQLRFADGRRAGEDGRKLTIGIRPEDVELSADGTLLRVDLVEPLGAETLVHGLLPGGEAMTLKLPGAPAVSDTVAIAIPADRIHVFDHAEGLRLEAA